MEKSMVLMLVVANAGGGRRCRVVSQLFPGGAVCFAQRGVFGPGCVHLLKQAVHLALNRYEAAIGARSVVIMCSCLSI
jgi:hypothetical protein